MTIETYDNLKQYVGSKDDFTDDLLNLGYTKGRADAIDEILSICHHAYSVSEIIEALVTMRSK